jgi:4-amino-4-deoxy-L-arabinose transferase-like glycosyltransferase
MAAIKDFFKNNKVAIVLFLAALTIKLLFLLLILWRQGALVPLDWRGESLLMGGDSGDYFILAKNLLAYHEFSLSAQAPFFSESFRTPGYPGFIALIWFFGRSLLAVAIVQDILAALSVAIFYKIVKLFFSERISRWAAALFLLEPTGLFLANIVMTETLFIFLFLGGLYLFLKQAEKPRAWLFLLAGLALGLAALTRTIVQFLPIFFIVSLFFFYRRFPLRKLLVFGSMFLLGFGLMVAPWSLRNKSAFDSWQLSSVGLFNFYHYHVPMFLAAKNNVSIPQMISVFQSKLDLDKLAPYKYHSLANWDNFKSVVKQVYLENPAGFTYFYFVKTLPFFLTDGVRDIVRPLGFISDANVNFSLSGLLLKMDVVSIFRQIFSGAPEFNLFLFGFLFWSLAGFFMLAAVVKSLITRDKPSLFLLFLFTLIIYFAAATGPVASGRFRSPVAPFIFLLAIIGFGYVWNKFKNLLAQKHQNKQLNS